MLDDDLTSEPQSTDPEGAAASAGAAATVRRRSIFEDRRVRALGIFAGALVVLYLALIIGALLSGVLGQSRPIQTAAERDLRLYAAKVEGGSKIEADWANYVYALIKTKQYGRAQSVLNDATKAGIKDPRKLELMMAQADLSLARKPSWMDSRSATGFSLSPLRKTSSTSRPR